MFPGRFIKCDTHGSRFRIGNGHFVDGPKPNIPDLEKFEVRIRNGQVQVR